MWENDFEIVTNSESDISVATLMGVMDLKARNYNFAWRVKGGGGYARTRNVLAYDFLKEKKAPYMIILDRDIKFTRWDIDKLLEDMKEGYHLIGGCYPIKDGTRLATCGYVNVDGGINEVEWLATGFGAISRELLEKMVDELKLPLLQEGEWSESYPFFEDHAAKDKNGRWMFLSEDYAFCEKARKVGVKPYLDTKIQVGHIGNKLYTVKDVMHSVNTKKLHKGLATENKRLESINEDLSKFFEVPIETVKEKVAASVLDQVTGWYERKGSIEDYYRHNEAYIYGGAWWNSRDDIQRSRLVPLMNVQDSSVLDFGCGIGSASLMLATQGNKVTGYDINELAIDFCNFRKNKDNIDIEFTTEKPDYSQFDLVIAIDVLEHIEDLRTFIMELGKGMKTGAKLYHYDDFKSDIRGNPMHFDHSEHIWEWLSEAGFGAWDATWAVKV